VVHLVLVLVGRDVVVAVVVVVGAVVGAEAEAAVAEVEAAVGEGNQTVCNITLNLEFSHLLYSEYVRIVLDNILYVFIKKSYCPLGLKTLCRT
jgi:hypothetical protein